MSTPNGKNPEKSKRTVKDNQLDLDEASGKKDEDDKKKKGDK